MITSHHFRIVGLLVITLVAVPYIYKGVRAQKPGADSTTSADRARLVVQLGHTSGIKCLAFSPDGRFIVTGGHEHNPYLWEVSTGKVLLNFEVKSYTVNAVEFSPDGRFVIIGSGDPFGSGSAARIWDITTGKEVRSFPHELSVNAVAFSGDGRYVLTGSGRGNFFGGGSSLVRLWDVDKGTEARRFAGHSSEVESVAFSPDGKYMLSGAADGACLWDILTGKEVRRFRGGEYVEFSPDGRYILTGGDQHSGWNEGEQVVARLWDVSTGQPIKSFDHKADSTITTGIYSIAYSPDGHFVLTGGRDGTARLWDIATGLEMRRFDPKPPGTSLKENNFNVVAIFSPDGRHVLTGGETNVAQLWEAVTGREVQRFEGEVFNVSSTTFSPDGRLILSLGAAMTPMSERKYEVKAWLWDTTTGQVTRQFEHLSPARSAVFSPDGRYVAIAGRAFRPGEVSEKGISDASLWDVETGKEIRLFQGHIKRLHCIAFSPDGRQLLTGDGIYEGTARLWDVKTGKEIRRFEGHKSGVETVAFSPDGRLIAIEIGGFENKVIIYDASTGRERIRFKGDEVSTESLMFTRDGRFLLAGSGADTPRLWDVATGKVVQRFAGHQYQVNSAVFSPDERTVVTASRDKTARLWDVETGKELRRFVGHEASIRMAAFSPDGRFVLTSSEDGTACLWNASTGRELCRIISFRDGTWAVVDPEGRYDASNGGVVEGLHWVIGNEPIALYQLKQRYYDPGLLAKIMGFNKEPLRDVSTFKNVRLFPQVEYVAPARDSTKLTVRLTNRGGGIGRVRVLVNGKEITADARGTRPDPQAARAELSVDLAGAAIKEGQPNTIEVLAWNAEGYLSSRGAKLVWTPDGQPATKPPEVYAVVGGISTYSSSTINLRYAAKDAEDFAKALVLGSKRLFGADKVHLTVLTTSGNAGTIAPTKENFRKAFEAARKAKPEDLFIVYLAGHGVALRLSGDNDTYCYLAQEARSTDLTDPAVRAASSITSDEMVEWIKQVPALKQVMILDTCAAGAAASRLIENRNVSSDQVRAIERLKDRTGFHVLMGSAADKVSYETSQFSQGLLTYALLEGMKGAALLKDEFIDVSKLFQYAADRVPELARSIRVGGIQRPLIAAPRGTSFEIGQLGKEDKQQIPLAREKPLILRPVFISSDQGFDDLDLMSYVRKRLEEESYAAPRGQATAEVVFVEADELPGAIRPFGQYRVEGNRIRVTVNLVRDGQRLGSFVVESRKGDPAGLAASIVAKIAEALKSIR